MRVFALSAASPDAMSKLAALAEMACSISIKVAATRITRAFYACRATSVVFVFGPRLVELHRGELLELGDQVLESTAVSCLSSAITSSSSTAAGCSSCAVDEPCRGAGAPPPGERKGEVAATMAA